MLAAHALDLVYAWGHRKPWRGSLAQSAMACLYDALEVSASATEAEIRTAYRRRALATHPDKGGRTEDFLRVVTAFETLCDADRRSAYDEKVAKQGRGSKPKEPKEPKDCKTKSCRKRKGMSGMSPSHSAALHNTFLGRQDALAPFLRF